MSASEHSFNLNFKTQGVESSLRDLRNIIGNLTLMEDGANAWLSLASRMNLPENLQVTITILQTTIGIVHALKAALIALQAASGPVGWLMLGIGAAVGIGTVVYSQMEMDARTGNY